MNIDDRLDRLTERHEALTESVQLMFHQMEEFWAKTREWQEEANKRLEKSEVQHQKNESLMGQVIESIDALSRVAHLHERRISNLEDQRGS